MIKPIVMPESTSAPAARRCANCGAAVPEAYCGVCGQRQGTRIVSVRRMAMDLLDDQLLVNSALPRTLTSLLFRPGHLTREYVAGRIVRYIAPFRLYLGSSLVFFLILTFLADPAELARQAEDDLGARPDSTATAEPGPLKARAAQKNMYVQFGALGDSTRASGWWKPAARKLAVQEARINGMSKGEIVRGLVSGLERNAPTAVFLLLPVYAAFLKVLYYRRKRLYVEHFVFALHIHAFTLLVLSVLLLTPATPLHPFFFLWMPVYAFLALRRVYGQGVMKTAGKFLLLGTSYVFAFCIGLLVTVAVAALTL